MLQAIAVAAVCATNLANPFSLPCARLGRLARSQSVAALWPHGPSSEPPSIPSRRSPSARTSHHTTSLASRRTSRAPRLRPLVTGAPPPPAVAVPCHRRSRPGCHRWSPRELPPPLGAHRVGVAPGLPPPSATTSPLDGQPVLALPSSWCPRLRGRSRSCVPLSVTLCVHDKWAQWYSGSRMSVKL
jgi:hypothetical protein